MKKILANDFMCRQLLLIFLVFISVNQLQAVEIGFDEKFTLAVDRSEPLKQLIPGTEDYYYYSCIYHQQLKDYSKVEEILKQWIKRYSYTTRVNEIINRQALITYSTNPQKAIKLIRERLNLHFNHQKKQMSRTKRYPDILKPGLFSFATLKSRAMRDYSDLSDFENMALPMLIAQNLNPDQRRNLLQRLDRPEGKNLPELVVEDLSHKYSGGFGSLKIHNKLLLPQLLECQERMPNLIDQQNFVTAVLKRMQPSEDENWQYDANLKHELLMRMWKFARNLSPSFNSLKAHLVYHILDLNRQKGNYNKLLFIQYLKFPRSANYMNSKYCESRENRHYKADLNANYQAQTLMPPIRNDESLVRDYFQKFLANEAEATPYFKFIDSNYLIKLFAETKITRGIGDMEKWFSMLSPQDVNSIKERIELEFLPTCPTIYKSSDKVYINVRVKNVKKLIAKIYKINAMNYYRQNLEEISTAVDLDGLVANEERTISYSQPEYLSHVEKFEFPKLPERGIFIIELIGNGISSRALIRKGQLSYMSRNSSAGQVLTIFNELQEQIKNASIWMDGREYTADKEGLINIPYSTNPGQKQLIIKHGKFASLQKFDHINEEYHLDGGFYVDREQLLEGKKAKVIFRPVILANGLPIDVALLQEVKLVVTSTDREGVASSKEVNDFKLFNDKDSIFEFSVPEKLSQLNFNLRAKIENLSQGKKQDLSISKAFTVNKISSTEKIEAFLPKHIAGEYVVYLLGKSGEPVVDSPVQIEIKSKYFKRTVHLTLQTNTEGKISLGQLMDVEWAKVSGNENISNTIFPSKNVRTLPSVITGLANSEISIPLMCSDDENPKDIFTLYEVRGGSYVTDHSANGTISGGFLHLKNLPPGDFELFIKSTQKAVQVKITNGTKIAGYLISDKRCFKAGNNKFLQISSIKAEKNSNILSIQLANVSPSTRIQVVASRFLPEFSIFDELGNFQFPTPDALSIFPPLSRFLSGRNIGDEYKYILERKYAQIFPGNMLKRPGLLLNPWSIRKTDTKTQEAAAGEVWKGTPEPETSRRNRDMPMRFKGGRAPRSPDNFANLDFLPSGSSIITNLKPDQNGRATINLNLISPAQQIHIIAMDHDDCAYVEYSLAEKAEDYTDIRMSRALNPERNFSEQKNISLVQKEQTFEVEDVTTAKVEVLDSLSSVYSLYSTLNPDAKLAEFAFITGWNKLKEAEKIELYSKYSCHELNFFLVKKDLEFFNKIVKPYIANKRDKTFMDDFLLDHNLSAYLDPWSYGRLNIVERILLAAKIDNEFANTKRHVEDLFDLLPIDVERFNHLFNTALKGSALEATDRLGLKKGFENARLIPPSPAAPSSAGFAREIGQIQPSSGIMAKKELLRSAKRPGKKSKMKNSLDAFDDSAQGLSLEESIEGDYNEKRDFAKDAGRRRQVRQLFKQLDTTEEWVENNYYKLPIEEQVAKLVTVNEFWKDFAANNMGTPFLSSNLAQASRNFTEMMFALSVLDLPFSPEKHETNFAAARMTLKPGSGVIVFHREIKPVKEISKTQSILTGQKFFARNDRYYHEKNQRFDKFVTEEFQTRRVYGCQIVLTNPTSSRKNVDVLIQIPNGAIPVLQTHYTRSINFQLEAFSTQTSEYYFYFPSPGTFIHYPVHVSEEETMIATTKPFIFKVVDELTNFDKTSWPYVSQNGTEKEVIEYLQGNNIDRLDLALMTFRLKNREFFESAYKLLKKRHVYHNLTWSYGLYHQNTPAISEFLAHSRIANECGTTLISEILTLNPVVRHLYQHKEYWPLVNARVYPLGKKREILNEQFAAQYKALLADLRYHDSLDDYDRLAVVYYLLLQDRIEEAGKFFSQISNLEIRATIQYQYMKAYLAFSNEAPEDAVKIAQSYRNYPVVRWNNLFKDVLAQAAEIQGKSAKVVDSEDRNQKQAVLADTQPDLEFSVENRQITLRYHNISDAKVNYYLMDIELLFSRKPFVQEVSGQFSVIQPNETAQIPLPAGKNELIMGLPEKFKDSNVMIEISSSGITKTFAYYPHSLAINLAEQYGQVKISKQQSGKALSKVYVKVYARLKNGQIIFYKDGYTDLRGKFDYASLSTNRLDSVEKFAILIMSENDGSVVREAAPPSR